MPAQRSARMAAAVEKGAKKAPEAEKLQLTSKERAGEPARRRVTRGAAQSCGKVGEKPGHHFESDDGAAAAAANADALPEEQAEPEDAPDPAATRGASGKRKSLEGPVAKAASEQKLEKLAAEFEEIREYYVH